MLQKSLLTSTLSALTLASILFTPVIQAEESVSLTEGLEPIHRTAMHPINAQELVDAGYVETYKEILLTAGVTSEKLNNISEEILKKAAFSYLITVGNEKVDPITAGQCLLFMVPDLFETTTPETSTPETSTPEANTTNENTGIILPMTRDDAVAYVDKEFYNTYMNSLKTYGITDEMLAKLPEEAVYNAAVDYLMTRSLLGDIKMPYRHFTHLYPEVLSPTKKQESSISEEDRKKNSEKSLKKQEKLRAHTQENLKDLVAKRDKLPKNFSFETENGKYDIKYLGVLAPGEAGNQSQDQYMLVVKYQFNNTGNQPSTTYMNDFEDHVHLSQNIGGQPIQLKTPLYQLENQEDILEIKEVAPGESTTARAYYLLEDRNTPALASILVGDTVSDYDIDLESLLQYPLQSALYQGEQDPGYLFDFDTIYLLYNQADQAKDWEGKENVEVKSLESLELSPEATIQTGKVGDLTTTAVQLKNINYRIANDNYIEVIDQDDKVLLTLKSDNGWQSFQDSNGSTFNIIK